MWIEIGQTLCRVTNASSDEQAWIQKYLSFEDTRWRGQRRGTRISLFSSVKGTFPGGLLPLVMDAAGRDGMKVELLDKRVQRITPDPSADLSWLRDYQLDAVEACCRHKRGIIRSPTASGKGDMIVGVVKRLPGRWLFLVHRDNLVSQQGKRYARLTGAVPNEVVGGDALAWRMIKGLNLMTLQSLAAGLRADKAAAKEALSELDGIIVDECHVAPADVYYSAIQSCPAEYRLGFSGTPLDRGDNRSLMAIACLGKVIYSIKPQLLIERGYLAAPSITMVTVKQKSLVKFGPSLAARAAAYHDIYDELIMDSDVRNQAVVDLVKQAPKPCMVFVTKIEHGRTLVSALRQAQVATEFVWGDKRKEAREAAVERLERGDSACLVASVVFQEGVDIPSLASVVVASGGKSVIAALQRVGRGMRTDQGRKAEFAVFDVLDVGSPMLERHARRRMNTYVREGYQTTIRAEDGTPSPYQPKLKTRKEKRAGGKL